MTDQPVEAWRPVPDWEGVYEASDLGRVRNAKTGRVKRAADHGGRRTVALGSKVYAVAYWVALAWVGRPAAGQILVRLDGDSRNDRADNLTWGTRDESNRRIAHRKASQVTHCPHGHEYTPENTARDSHGRRYCRACRLAQTRRARGATAEGIAKKERDAANYAAGVKTCAVCGQTKPHDAFTLRRAHGKEYRQSYCRSCASRYQADRAREGRQAARELLARVDRNSPRVQQEALRFPCFDCRAAVGEPCKTRTGTAHARRLYSWAAALTSKGAE